MTDGRKKTICSVLLLIGIVTLPVHTCDYTSDTVRKQSQALLEIPRQLHARDAQIIVHIGYVVSYNCAWRLPNWVAYELTRNEVDGTEPRSNFFKPDPEVPPSCSAEWNDYRRSGFDRGHMAPAGDMKWSRQAMEESFYLSNICPQNHELNAGKWNEIEQLVRRWARESGKAYVVCGPIVEDNHATIGANRVAVPSAFFKVVLRQKAGTWQGIAFKCDNISDQRTVSSYAISIDSAEQLTGIDFFPLLPDKIEKAVERTFDPRAWKGI